MEQKTEASQAVDERQTMMEALSMCIDALGRDADRAQRETAAAKAIHVLGRAALMAQPAPAEAPSPAGHAIHNLKEYRAGRMPFPGEAIGILEAALTQPAPTEAQGESPFKFRPWSKEAEMVEGWTEAEKARNEAQGEDSARLDADMLALLIREAGILNERGMAWLLNGDSISLNLTNLLAIANMIEDRASAETGGVKP